MDEIQQGLEFQYRLMALLSKETRYTKFCNIIHILTDSKANSEGRRPIFYAVHVAEPTSLMENLGLSETSSDIPKNSNVGLSSLI